MCLPIKRQTKTMNSIDFWTAIFLGRQCCSLVGICVLEVYVVVRIRGITTVNIVVNVH